MNDTLCRKGMAMKWNLHKDNDLFVGDSVSVNNLVRVTDVGLGSISPTCLSAAFTHSDPKNAKKTVESPDFVALWGSVFVKAALNMLVKLTPGVDSCTKNLTLKRSKYLN